MKRFTAIIAIVLLCVCYGSLLPDTMLQVPFVVDGSISVEGDPEVNPEITITFVFMLKPEGPYYQQMKEFEERFAAQAEKGDSAAVAIVKELSERIDHASLLPDTNVEYLTNPVWTGQIKPLQKYEFIVKARLRHEMPTQLVGVVETYCGTATFPSQCRSANYFVSDTLFRGIDIAKPAPPKPDTLWRDGHPIIIQTIHKPVLQIDTIPPVEKIEGPVPPHRQPERKTISAIPSQRGLGAIKETAGSYLVTGHFFNVYIPHDTVPAAGCSPQRMIGCYPYATPKLVWGCLIFPPGPGGRGDPA